MKFNYRKYFSQIRPKTKMEIYNRFLFSFCSVHTTWERNIIAYELLKDVYHTNKEALRTLILKAGVGLTNNRTEFIYEFTQKFLENHKIYLREKEESWKSYATRLTKIVKGLGFAKARFAIELIYPNTAQICCVDTHIIQWAKQNPNKMNLTLYKKIEEGWINHSKVQGLNPVEARWKWWDKKQGYEDPRYWSHVLENDKRIMGDISSSIGK